MLGSWDGKSAGMGWPSQEGVPQGLGEISPTDMHSGSENSVTLRGLADRCVDLSLYLFARAATMNASPLIQNWWRSVKRIMSFQTPTGTWACGATIGTAARSLSGSSQCTAPVAGSTVQASMVSIVLVSLGNPLRTAPLNPYPRFCRRLLVQPAATGQVMGCLLGPLESTERPLDRSR